MAPGSSTSTRLPGRRSVNSINLYLDTSSIDLDAEGLMLHTLVCCMACRSSPTAPIDSKRLIDEYRNRVIQRLAGGNVDCT